MSIDDILDRLYVCTEDFDDIAINYTDYCGYYRNTGELCPLIKEDLKQKGYDSIYSLIDRNFNLTICQIACSYFIKVDIPLLLKLKEVKKDGKL